MLQSGPAFGPLAAPAMRHSARLSGSRVDAGIFSKVQQRVRSSTRSAVPVSAAAARGFGAADLPPLPPPPPPPRRAADAPKLLGRAAACAAPAAQPDDAAVDAAGRRGSSSRGPNVVLAAASTGLAFGSFVDISPLASVCLPRPPAPRSAGALIAQVGWGRPPPPPPPSSATTAPALAPALIALAVAYLAGFFSGGVVSRRRAKARLEMAAALRASSGRDALQRARAVLEISLDDKSRGASRAASPKTDSATTPAAFEAALAGARAEAAEAGLATQTAQLRELQGALAIAGEEFEEALSDKAAAEEEVELLRQILAEKDSQLRALEELAGGVLGDESKLKK